MRLFKRNMKSDYEIHPPSTGRVEIELAKGASKHAAERAKDVNQHLNSLLVNNGFTLKIYLAKGGNAHSAQGKKT